ncbi:hypothetical protein T439DRAFT_322869 [Meredithblackwellia eburnea MCA 4105]
MSKLDFQPPAYSPQVPPAGNRIPASTTNDFPHELSGTPPCLDLGGQPVYVASALMGTKSVQPCKAAPHLDSPCRVPYGGQEISHSGRFDILPITEMMEWVLASNGELPKGRRPVEGGYEENGEHLFHALVPINGHDNVVAPGKTGPHLRAAHVAWNGGEMVVRENYKVLCWR